MPIRQHTCYVAVCDECKNDYENVDMWTPHFDSAGEAMDEAEGNDWAHLADGSVFCDCCIPDLVARGVIEKCEDGDVAEPAYRRVAVSLPDAEDGAQ
jgi:hypothetical protein